MSNNHHHHGHHCAVHKLPGGSTHTDGKDSLRRLQWAFVLNFSFAIIELFGGYWTNSVAISSDALHDLGDSLALLMALILQKWSVRQSDSQFSYGYKRLSTLGALITSVILLLGSAVILYSAISRFWNPVEPHAEGMFLFALLGVSVNGFAAYKLSKGSSLNEKMVLWHLVEDTLGWVLVLFGSIAIYFFHLPQLDAILAIVLAIWIAYNVVRNTKQVLKVFLMATPDEELLVKVQDYLKKLPEVLNIHHCHLWSLDGEQHIFTAHLLVDEKSTWADLQNLKNRIKADLHQWHIFEATLELEAGSVPCADEKHNV
jgi:cobalt-zinc-cadmium efflux system protein